MPAITARPTLILLHGFRGAPQGLAAIADDLRAAGYTVQTPPVPPFAGAPALSAYTPDTYADYFAHYLKAQPFQRPVIIGHSMGSIVAAALAERYPELIHPKLILLSPISVRPSRFFARLNPDAPQWRSLFYYLVVVLVLIGTQLFWLHMSREVLEQNLPPNNVFGMLIRFAIEQPLLYGLTAVASFVFQLYILSALLLLGFRIAGVRHAAFYLIFQVVAYSAAPVLLCLIPVLGVQVGIIWSMACIITGCRMALGLDWSRTLLGFALPILFCVLMFMFGLPR